MPGALLFGTAVYFYAKELHSHQNIVYIIALTISILGYLLPIEPIIEGELAIGVWLLVMFAGALNPKWKITRQLRLVRKELSIIGFFLISTHGLFYFMEGDLEWYGIVANIMMFPLTVISFDVIRKKMTYKMWKNIQKLAYLIYALIFIHLIMVGSYVYIPIGLVYFYLKLSPVLAKRNITLQRPVRST